MTIIAKLLKDSGFATTAGQDGSGKYLDVFLSTEDANAVLAEHKTGGLKSVDAAVRRFGKLLLSKLGSDASDCVIDGYWVDPKTQKIAVRIAKAGVEKKADDGGAKEKVNKISENESIKNDFISLHDSMVTMRTKPTSGGDADLTEKKNKVREAAGKSAGRGTKKTAEEPMPMTMDAPGGESAPAPTEMPDTIGMPDAAGDTPGSVEAFEQAEKGFIDYITTSVPVDRAVEIATDIYEQVGSGKSEDKPKSEGSSEPKEEKAEEHEESETPAEEKKEEEGTEKKESLKKTETVKEACLRFRRLAFNLRSMKGKKLSAETKDEIDEVIDKAVKGLEENVPLEEATKIMQDAMSGQSAAPETAPAEAAPEAAPEGGEAAPGSEMAFASIKNKLAKKQKSTTKKTAAGYDIVTDTWSGKPEGKPEQSVEDHDGLAAMPGYKKEPTVEDITYANEKPKVDKPKDTPDFAQETVKKAVLAFKAVEHMTSTGSIEESQREDEFARLMKMSDAQFKAEIYNIRKISGKVSELVVDGKYADLNTIFN
jgi:hypothetical protein